MTRNRIEGILYALILVILLIIVLHPKLRDMARDYIDQRPVVQTGRVFLLSHLPGSNWGPQLYESCALPTELRWR